MRSSRTLMWLCLSPALTVLWVLASPRIQAQASGVSMPAGDPVRGEKIALSCSRCHGERGISTQPWIPSLAGLSQRVLYKQLDDYRGHRRRPEWYMGSIAQALSTQDSADVSAFYERQARARSEPVTAAQTKPDATASCRACHSAHGGAAPDLTGQQPQYLEIQLSLFAQGIRSNDPDSVMRNVAGQLTMEQIRQISESIGKPSR